MRILTCQACGANIDIDEAKEFGTCSFCGTKTMLHDVVNIRHSGNVSIDSRQSEIHQLITNAETQIKFKEYIEAEKYIKDLIKKYSDEQKGYYFAIIVLTKEFDKKQAYALTNNDLSTLESYLSKLKALGFSDDDFIKKVRTYIELVKYAAKSNTTSKYLKIKQNEYEINMTGIKKKIPIFSLIAIISLIFMYLSLKIEMGTVIFGVAFVAFPSSLVILLIMFVEKYKYKKMNETVIVKEEKELKKIESKIRELECDLY